MLFIERWKTRRDIKNYVTDHRQVSDSSLFDTFTDDAEALSKEIKLQLDSILSIIGPDTPPAVTYQIVKLTEFFSLAKRIYEFEINLFLSMSKITFDIKNPDDVSKYLICSAIKDVADSACRDEKESFSSINLAGENIADPRKVFNHLKVGLNNLIRIHIPLIQVLYTNYMDIFPDQRGSIQNLKTHLSIKTIKELDKTLNEIDAFMDNDSDQDYAYKLLEKISILTFITGIIFAVIGIALLAIEGDGQNTISLVGQNISTKNSGLGALFIASVMIMSTIKQVLNIINNWQQLKIRKKSLTPKENKHES